MEGALSQLKKILVDDPTNYWIEEPKEIGYAAFDKAADIYGVDARENTRADAAKHMAWQNELARRTLLPQAVGGTLANLVGLSKEAYESVVDENARRNSLMDLLNNIHGAYRLPLEGDTINQAVQAAALTVPSREVSFRYGLPNALYEEPRSEPKKAKPFGLRR